MGNMFNHVSILGYKKNAHGFQNDYHMIRACKACLKYICSKYNVTLYRLPVYLNINIQKSVSTVYIHVSCAHTYIHYITLRYVTLRYITFIHYITLHYITLHTYKQFTLMNVFKFK